MDELNDCCKVVAQINDRVMERVRAETAAVVEQLQGRIEELEKLAFEKARAVSGLEGQIAGLKYELAAPVNVDVHVKMPPIRTTPVVITPAAQPAMKKCVVCGRECISMCPECKALVCNRQECGQAHGHGSMYTSST